MYWPLRHLLSLGTGSQKATVEEVEDEEADGGQVGDATGSKKKKKKKASKKKKSTASGEAPSSPILAPASPRSAPATPKKVAAPPATPRSPTAASASASTLHIPIGETQAQSGHSYKKQLESDFQQKAKVKSRPDHASMFSNDESKSKGINFFSKITSGFKKEAPEEPESNKNPKYTWFSRLSKKATDSMHQLLRTGEEAGKQPAPMKWDTFVKVLVIFPLLK
jgi:hypothetical protein